MAGRKIDPNSKYKLIKHTSNKYCYAATVNTVQRGDKSYRKYVHWGTLDINNKFKPNLNFSLLTLNEQRKFIFPDNWDLTNINYIKSLNNNLVNEQTHKLKSNIDHNDINESQSDKASNICDNCITDDNNLIHNENLESAQSSNKINSNNINDNKNNNIQNDDNLISSINSEDKCKNDKIKTALNDKDEDKLNCNNKTKHVENNSSTNLTKDEQCEINNIVSTKSEFNNSDTKKYENTYNKMNNKNNNDEEIGNTFNNSENNDNDSENEFSFFSESDKIKDKIINIQHSSNKTPELSHNPLSVNDQFNNLLYGHVWFLIKIAEKYNLIEDLNIVFEYNNNIVNDIITLAIFPYLTQWNFDRCERWQNIVQTPSNHKLTSYFITRFTQKITDNHRMTLIALRLHRQPDGAFVACDSTTRSAWGNCLAEIRWGKNKDNPKLKNTVEVVVYSLTTHEPIYYRSFAGNAVDIRTIKIICSDFLALGIPNLIFLFDRGYDSIDNIVELIYNKIPFLIFSKTIHEIIYSLIITIEYDEYRYPLNMEYDKNNKLYYTQIDLSGKKYTSSDGKCVVPDDFKCDLYLDYYKRVDKMAEIHEKIQNEITLVNDKISNIKSEKDLKLLNKKLVYHKLVLKNNEKSDNDDLTIDKIEIVKKDDRIKKDKNIAGFFSCLNYKMEGTAIEHLDTYKLKDEQEKYFYQMKDQMNFHTQNCSSEDGKQGRLFILFAGLILSSKVKFVWKNSENLRKKFKTSYDVIDEMKSIRLACYPNGIEHMTPFSQSQIDICKEYGIDVPIECLSTTEAKQACKQSKKEKNNENQTK